MSDHSFTTGFSVDRTPKEAFDAITNVRGWWSEEIDGGTAGPGDEFTYRAGDIHRCRIRVTEAVPDRKISWLVVENHFDFTEDQTEWTGTTITFDIAEKDGQTEVRFTHQGLVPEHECFDVCSTSWGFYVNDSLQSLITAGEGQPNRRSRPPAPAGDPEAVRGRRNAGPTAEKPKVVSAEEWQQARDDLLRAEKATTRALDVLAARRRRLPMVRFDTGYAFETPEGTKSLLDLFDGREQLVVYQFMDNGPEHYCPGCTWFTNNVPSTAPALLAEQGITWMTVSNMPLAQIEVYKARMGWTLPFASSHGTTFAHDCGADGGFQLSVFLRDGANVYLTYTTKGRGIDRLTFVTSVLDLTAFGRQEEWENSPPGWPQQTTAYFPSTMPLQAKALSFGRFQ